MQYGSMTKIVLPLTTVIMLGLASHAQATGSASNSSSSSSSSSDNGSSKHSQSHSSTTTQFDQDDARDALRKGKVMPLTAILEIAGKREPGTVLDAELETENGVLTYKIDILSDAGRKARLRLNARTGDIIAVDYR